MSQVEGYTLRIATLRIATGQWVNQVFSMAIYYTNLRRKWRRRQSVLFMHKTSVGDALVGYGLIEKAWEKDELCEQDKRECERGGWKRAIEFIYLKQFDKPLAVRDTFLKDSKLRGRYFHGLRLDEDQLRAIVTQAETQR